MPQSAWLFGLIVLAQVPPPSSNRDQAGALKTAARQIQAREALALKALADKLGSGREPQSSAAAVRRLIAEPTRQGDVTRLVPLAEIVPAQGRGLASISSGPLPKVSASGTGGDWTRELRDIKARSAGELFDLAGRAAAESPPHYAFAGQALRQVLERDPDHREARRLLGYVPHEGGWARPFAVRQLREGNVSHPIYGWVPADWVPHLERGALPAPSSRGQKRVRWLAAEEADRLRSDLKNGWKIATEHFEIQTDVPLAEAIEFGRRLENFHDLFFALMADVLGDNLPLARRFRSQSLVGESNSRPHLIQYFASKEEYVEHLRPTHGHEIEQSLGYYNPPRPGRGNRAPAYFFRDPGGQLPVTATLYHEVSHQLLFESAGPNSYTRNAGNYWVFEGLGTYFETVTPRSDGSLEVGGRVGARMEEAMRSAAAGKFMPLERFILQDQNAFNRPEQIHVNYQQAMALTAFLMQQDDSTHRDAFLDYVLDAYRGRIKQSTGRTLEDRLGQPYRVLDQQFRAFLAQPTPRPS